MEEFGELVTPQVVLERLREMWSPDIPLFLNQIRYKAHRCAAPGGHSAVQNPPFFFHWAHIHTQLITGITGTQRIHTSHCCTVLKAEHP